MKKIISLMAFLGLVSAISGGVLAYVNSITAPIIANMSIAQEKANLEIIFPGTTYEEVSLADETGLVTGGYIAQNEGYIYKAEVYGYSSTPIIFMVGIDNDGAIAGFSVLSHQETSGIGSRIATDEYSNLVLGLTASDTVDTLSGATVSTSAVKGGIEAIFEEYNNALGLGPIEKDEEPEAEVEVETALTLAAEFSATIDTIEEGVYTVYSKGFEGEHKVIVTIIDGVIDSVVIEEFVNNDGIGTDVNSDDFLAQFSGLSVSDDTTELDVISGATVCSEAIIGAVATAAQDAASAASVNTDGSTTTFANVEAYGFTYQTTSADANILTVVCDSETGSVVSVSVDQFNDTVGLGDQATTSEYLETFVGATLDSIDGVDTVSGATMTSSSIIEAVKICLQNMMEGA
ncbi:MAG: FMN-binding protein [Erysipelotrichaceae bacterium]